MTVILCTKLKLGRFRLCLLPQCTSINTKQTNSAIPANVTIICVSTNHPEKVGFFSLSIILRIFYKKMLLAEAN